MTEVFIHSSAIVETTHIGEGTRIWAYTHVMRDVAIGAHCNIGEHCFIESGSTIGNQVTIKNGNMVWEGVHLEDGVFVGPSVIFTNDVYPRSPRLFQVRTRYADRGWLKSTVIKQGASLGAAAVILPGITIGEFCMVGAGSIVNKSLPPYALVVGSPARVRGWVCQCGQPLLFSNDAAVCAEVRSRIRQTGAVRRVAAGARLRGVLERVRVIVNESPGQWLRHRGNGAGHGDELATETQRRTSHRDTETQRISWYFCLCASVNLCGLIIPVSSCWLCELPSLNKSADDNQRCWPRGYGSAFVAARTL